MKIDVNGIEELKSTIETPFQSLAQQLDQKNTPVYGVKLEKAFPVNMDAIELNQETQDLVRMSVTFAYDKYVPEGPLSSTASAIRSALDIFG